MVDKMARSFSNSFSDTLIEGKSLHSKALLEQTLQEFVDVHQETQIRVLTDQQFVGTLEPGMVVQIDEYDFRVQLLQDMGYGPQLEFEQLVDFQYILETNSSTVALLLTWDNDELLTIPLTIARIRFLQQRPRLLPRLLQRARPLLAVLEDLIARQSRVWEDGLDLSQRAVDEPVDIRQVFAASLEEAFEKERNRSYRQPARKQAAHYFPVELEKQAILAILDEALKGESASKLVKRLIEDA